MMISDERTLRLRRYLRHIILTAGRISRSKRAMEGVHDQMRMVKAASTLGADHHVIHKEIDKLRDNFHDFLRADKKLRAYHHESSDSENKLRDKIGNVERKLDLVIDLQQNRQNKITSLEEKFQKRMTSQQEKLREVVDTIRNLEKEYRKLEKSGKYDKGTLKGMKKRIDEYKKKIKIGVN